MIKAARWYIELIDLPNRDWNFGSINGRQLCIRPIVPWPFQDFVNLNYRFRWRNLANPVSWYRWITRYAFSRREYRLWWKGGRGWTHRCYCDTGNAFDMSLCVAGFGFVLFYSNFTGDLPCPCDQACEELSRNDS